MEQNIYNITSTGMNTSISNYKVPVKAIDEATGEGETYWTNPDWPIYLGYLKTIPEYRNAVRSLAIWSCGKGYLTDDTQTEIDLENIRGWGEDTFDSIMQDMIVVKKTNGDAYAEIVREGNRLINLKKLNPSSVRHVVNKKGILIGYDVHKADKTWQRFKVNEIFHISNDRIANEIHGVSVLESCKWIIDFKNEMLADLRRLMHRSSIRIMYIEMDNTTRLNQIKTEYATAIKNGELLIIPAKRGEAEIVEYSVPPTEAWLAVIRYIDNYFYEVLGVPRAITGGNEMATEANSKVGYLSFEVPYMTEQRLLEQDLWNQLRIRLTFNRPVSLKEPMVNSEAANTGQVGFQPNEVNASMTKNE